MDDGERELGKALGQSIEAGVGQRVQDAWFQTAHGHHPGRFRTQVARAQDVASAPEARRAHLTASTLIDRHRLALDQKGDEGGWLSLGPNRLSSPPGTSLALLHDRSSIFLR